MSAAELSEHAGYLGDLIKLAAYEQAFNSVLRAGSSVVLDLGSGTGILGLLAAKCGADRVFAVDSGAIIGPAAEVAAASNVADRIVHIRGRSTELQLPEPANVAVCDQIGGFVYDAGILAYFADARARLLATDATLIPARFRMFLAPAECRRVREQIDLWSASPAGFDFAAFSELAANTEYRVDADEVRLLANGVQVADIAADHIAAITGTGDATFHSTGRCDGLVGFFEADMGGGATLTNHPTVAARMRRWCNFYPMSTGLQVEAGYTAVVKVDVRPALRAVTWTTTVTDASQSLLVSERHSTLMGTFLAHDDLGRAGGRPITVSPTGTAVATALQLADGNRSTGDVLATVKAGLTEGSWSSALEETLRDQLERFTSPVSDSSDRPF